ncbi:MAG: hypothetical protein HY866_13890, partial [Chloroflexi bacterium]|nr:hypothetical protein [Chloroflexota bacterium]
MIEGCGGCCLSLILIPLLCLAIVACGVIYVYTNGPEPPLSDRFKASSAEAQAFDTAIQNAANQITTGSFDGGGFVIQFDQRQMSSWLTLEGQDFAEDHDRSFPFENVQVKLDGGKMIFYGELARYRLNLPLRVTIKPDIDKDGKLKLKVESADFGGLNLPGVLLKEITRVLEDALMQPIDDLGYSYTLFEQTLVIEDGVFSMQG